MPQTELNSVKTRAERLRAFRAGTPNPPEASVASAARAFTVRGETGAAGQAVNRLAAILRELAAVARQGGALVGHIKAMITFDDGASAALSVVRDQVQVKAAGLDPASPVGRFKLAATAIVYHCSKDELTRLLNLGLAAGFPADVYAPAAEMGKPLPIDMFQSTRLRPAQ